MTTREISLQQVKQLANRTLEMDEKAISLVLHTLSAAIMCGDEMELASICGKFAENKLEAARRRQ